MTTKPEKDGELRPCPYHGDPKAMIRDTVSGEFAYCEKCSDGDREPGIWYRPVEDWNNSAAWKLLDEAENKAKAYREMCERLLNRMKKINEDDERCVVNPAECPNHSLIHEAERLMKGEL